MSDDIKREIALLDESGKIVGRKTAMWTMRRTDDGEVVAEPTGSFEIPCWGDLATHFAFVENGQVIAAVPLQTNAMRCDSVTVHPFKPESRTKDMSDDIKAQ